MKNVVHDNSRIIEIEDNILAWVDNDTGLMWEIKNKHNINSWYVWHTSNLENIAPETKDHFETTIQDSTSYINRLNENEYAGYDDWRLPTIEELETLIEMENTNSSGNNIFIKKPLLHNSVRAYWSSSPDMVVNVMKRPGADWRDTAHIPGIKIVDFTKPKIVGYSPNNALWIRCVRASDI